MGVEKSRIKFALSQETNKLIGFVSRHPKKNELRGVREDYEYGKKICVLSEKLQGTILPNTPYDVELTEMRNGKGYVVISAVPVLFPAKISTIIKPKTDYKVTVSFGNKIVYLDPRKGKTNSSRTVPGVLEVLSGRVDVEDLDEVIRQFKERAEELITQMKTDGVYPPQTGIATDAMHSRLNRLTAFRGIDLETGRQLFYEALGNQTVNIGEFLGVVEAVKYILENENQPKIIYTDSLTAIAWFRNKKCASKKNYAPLQAAEIYLKSMATRIDNIQLIHWNTELWGEIPADFGNK